MNTEVAKDLISLVNSLKEFEKSKSVKYGQTTFDYVPLDDLLARIKMNDKWGVLQPLSNDANGTPCVETWLIHESGEVIKSGTLTLYSTGAKMQDFGSVITYTKRYQLGAFLGISTETDNDANPDSEVKDLKVNDKTLIKLVGLLNQEDTDKILSFYKVSKLGDITEKNALALIEKRTKK